MCIFEIHVLYSLFICIFRQVVELDIENFNGLLRDRNVFDLVQTFLLVLLGGFLVFFDFTIVAGRRTIIVVVLIISGLKSDFVIVADPFQIIRIIIIVLTFNEIRPQNLGLRTVINWTRMFGNPRLRLEFILNGRSCLSDLRIRFFFLFFLSGINGLFRGVLVQHLEEICRKV